VLLFERGIKVFQISLHCKLFAFDKINTGLPEILSCLNEYVYSLVFTSPEGKRYWYAIHLTAVSLEDRVRVCELPRDLEVIDIALSDDLQTISIYDSNGITQFESERVMKKVKGGLGRKRMECNLELTLLKPVKESIITKVLRGELFTFGVYVHKKLGISIDRNSIVELTFEIDQPVQIKQLFTFDNKNEHYDKLDVIKTNSGLHLAFARFNDFQDLLIFMQDTSMDDEMLYDEQIPVFDSRIYRQTGFKKYGEEL
jgi:hypothetical protein